MTTTASFSALLYAYRKRRGWTQEELAARWNYSKETISSWERGKRSPGMRDLPRLAHLLDMDQEELASCIHKRNDKQGIMQDTADVSSEMSETWGELQRIYRNRTEFTRDFSYPRMLEQANHLLAVGISLNAITLNYDRRKIIEAIATNRSHYDLCFLDPDGFYCTVREKEEDYENRTIANLTRMNINHVQSVRGYLKKAIPECLGQLQVRLYDLPPRMNIYIADNALMVVQFYLYARGEDTPTFMLKRQADSGLFDFYASAARLVFEQARPLDLPSEREESSDGPEQ